jgi:hypothetical protein
MTVEGKGTAIEKLLGGGSLGEKKEGDWVV